VTNKPARQSLRHCVGVQYPGRMHWQPCLILYIALGKTLPVFI